MSKHNLILLAMDVSPTQGLLDRALRSAGYGVAHAPDVESLNRALSESGPVVLLLTQTLDGQDGLRLAEGVLDRFPTLPILLYADEDNVPLFKQAIRAGISDFLYPPLRIDDIVAVIKQNQKRAEQTGDWVRREVRRGTASLEKRMSELETLLKLGQTINSSLTIDDVLTSVVTAAVELTGAEEGQLLLMDEETSELYMRAGRNFEENFARTFRLPIRDSIAGQVVHSGQTISFCQDSPSKIKTAYLVYALIYVPLRIGDQVIGVLGVDNRQNKRPFSQHHELLMSVLADYAGIAIKNAQFFEQTEQERQKLDATLSNIQDGVILLDSERKILLINPAARKVFGLGLSDLTGQPVTNVISNDDFFEMLNSIRENPLQHHEMTFDDGRVFNTQYVPIPEVGSVITFEEITHLKMLDRLKSDFIHTISHDLRSPLTAIMGYVELLGRVGPLNDQQKLFVGHVQNSAQNITILINDLLDLGRIEAGFDTRKDEVGFDKIVQYTLDNVNQQIVEKAQTLSVVIDKNLPPLRGNPIRLRQLADNLIVNAVKYTPHGGSLTVNIRHDNDQVIFEVIDTGLGIPLADQPHIFEKFYRASNTPKNAPGTGLGLAIVRSIVESHDGRIWLESAVGQGSKFVVVLPVYKRDDDE
jgi:two-component system, OmpR family, phosphate regulon sensor histidine kinase PhoR